MGFCLDFGVFYASAVLIATRTFISLGMEIDQGGRIRNVKLMDSGISDYWAIARLETESFGEDAWTALDMIPVLLNGDIFSNLQPMLLIKREQTYGIIVEMLKALLEQ